YFVVSNVVGIIQYSLMGNSKLDLRRILRLKPAEEDEAAVVAVNGRKEVESSRAVSKPSTAENGEKARKTKQKTKTARSK
ncbi:MAG: hypothetical protein K8L99_28845, partial [Anaerolineae bacterium]|nr:hypothetical protein [Anaerolineae bacterium]